MSKVIISAGIDCPYSFKDKNGNLVEGSIAYSLMYDGFGKPKIIKTATLLVNYVEIDKDEMVFDFKGRLII